MEWTETARKGYAALYGRMVINPSRMQEATNVAKRLLSNRARYELVAAKTNVPWWFIAILHERESGADFNTYLGNGQRLDRVTTLVPEGRGPFYGADAFDRGAIDALEIQGYTKIQDWSVEHALYLIEAFNGWGYTGKGVNSPYIWGGSNNYVKGKYVADHVFDADAVDKQLGGAVVLKLLSIFVPMLFGKVVEMTVEKINENIQVATGIATPIQLAPANTITTDKREAILHQLITAIGLAAALAGFHSAPSTLDAITSLPFVSGILFSVFGIALNFIGLDKANANTLTMVDQVAQYIIRVEREKLAAQAEASKAATEALKS